MARGRAELSAYVTVHAAAVRMLLPLAVPAEYAACVVASAVLWPAAFLVFTVAYYAMLSRPWLDGRAG